MCVAGGDVTLNNTTIANASLKSCKSKRFDRASMDGNAPTFSASAHNQPLFSLSPNPVLLFFTKFGAGVTKALMAIFIPLWVDCYAPKPKITLWMSVFQGAAPFGIMFGYIFAGLVQAMAMEYFEPGGALDRLPRNEAIKAVNRFGFGLISLNQLVPQS